MIVLDVEQGTPEWEDIRAQHDTASEAPAMKGASPNVKRSELLRMKALGDKKKFSAWVEEVLFERGHAVEALARPIAAKIIGKSLFPAVALSDDRTLLASFDGLTMAEDEGAEIKQWNEEKAAHVREFGTVPPCDFWQVVQQLAVSGLKRWLYVVSDGTEEKTVYCWMQRDEAVIEELRAGWAQFRKDVASYVLPPPEPVLVAAPVTRLPAVLVQVDGIIKIRENFEDFRIAVTDFLENRLIREPKTDQDFVDLDQQIKDMMEAEEALDGAEAQMLAQIQPIHAAKQTKDILHKLVRDNRLIAQKLLASEKDRRRAEIILKGKDAFAAHIADLNKALGGKILMPEITTDFAGVIKNKRTLSSLQDAVDTELARGKIEADRVGRLILANLEILRTDGKGFETLFMDAQKLVVAKSPDDMVNLVKARIAAHKEEQAETQRQFEAKIRAEAEAKAQLEAEQKAEVERERIRKEERERADREADERRKAEDAERARLAALTPPKADEPASATAAATSTAGVAPTPAANSEPPVARAAASIPTSTGAAHMPVADSGALIKLGDINARIAPLSISADGLSQLGFHATVERSAKLYRASDLPRIVATMIVHLQGRIEMQRAA